MMATETMQTEFEFELPKGYVDKEGIVHRNGVMRLATAADEIIPLKDTRVQINPGFLSTKILSRVIVKLGTLKEVTSNMIENMFTADVAYLEKMYQTINSVEPMKVTVECPHCKKQFQVEVPFVGEP